jgi:hypothetical protein
MKCCFCKKDVGEYGNNAQPVMDGRCCDSCNETIVIPIRILKATNSPLLKIGEEIQKTEEKLKLLKGAKKQ